MARYNPWPRFGTAMDRLMDLLNDDKGADDLEVLWSVDHVIEALQACRDYELLDLIGHGHTRAEIATHLGVSTSAVAQQVKRARARQTVRRQGS